MDEIFGFVLLWIGFDYLEIDKTPIKKVYVGAIFIALGLYFFNK